MSFLPILIKCSQISTIIPLMVGLYYVKRLDIKFKVLLWFVGLSLFVEYFASWYTRHISHNNLPPLHFYTVIELGCLAFVFCRQFYSKWQAPFGIILLSGTIVALLNASVWGTLNEMNNISRSFESIILVIGSLMFFQNSLTEIELKTPITKQPLFWFSSAVFLYFSVNLLFFMLFNKVLKENKEMISFGQMLHSITNILTNLLFAQSFRCFKKAEL